ncbi:unnamed protein product [Allacma fusca]|uniref:Huntingtin interacting protein 1 n=1 Tax=Allacma fusca TaxID=39272 RepID=A0A8J2L0W1_9HEXA|nr:unnamed protein product [Allacma fusca]
MLSTTSTRNSRFGKREEFPPVVLWTCLQKAINTQETAVKEKHVRSAIIGTYQERGATTFWDCILRLPLRENAIVCWKFCHVLHKVLREGHDHVLRDSQRFRPMLQEHGRFWSHLKTGYGSLIKIYCNLLHTKLNFHLRNNRIPGNLEMDDQQLIQCAGDSEDAFFQMSVEMFDYLDGILELQSEIFKTMDSSRCNSMTNAGQCRLKPLIPCIQDSMLLYDYATKILFRLHAKLSPDLLGGHRERFLKVFHGLQQFYAKTMSLQYFKNLIDIQQLPKNPPNFLIQSDLENYETRKVTVYSSERDMTDNHSDTTSDLVDLQDLNGSGSPDPSIMALVLEKERVIEDLRAEVERLKAELTRLQMEARNQIRQLQLERQELRAEIQEKNSKLTNLQDRVEELELHECKGPPEQVERLDRAEKHIKVVEEKFGKMKDVYTGLREEHIDLLRKKAVVDKELADIRRAVDNQSELGVLLEKVKQEKEETENEFIQKLTSKIEECEALNRSVDHLKTQIEEAKFEKEDTESELTKKLTSKSEECEALDRSVESLKSQIEKVKQEKDNAELELMKQLATKTDECESLDVSVNQLKSQIEQLETERVSFQTEVEGNLGEKTAECSQLYETITSLKSQIKTVESTKDELETGLNRELELKTAELETLASVKGDLEKSKESLAKELETLMARLQTIEKELSQSHNENKDNRDEIGILEGRITDNQKNMEADALRRYNELLDVSIDQNEAVIRKTLEDLENPTLIGGTGSLDHFILFCRAVLQNVVPTLQKCSMKNLADFNAIKDILEQLPIFTHHHSSLLLYGGATSKISADIQKGDEMLNDCKNLGHTILALMEAFRARKASDAVEAAFNDVYGKLHVLLETAQSMGRFLTPEADAADALDKELHSMEAAIEEASKKMEEMLSKSRASHTGVKLEVNEKLIDSCTALMNSIRLLVQTAKKLQSEIAAQGRGSASVKEFYKRNHQWTEGLISAAKSVGIGAKFLLESADKAVTNPGGNFEFLIASSQEIAASTIQLVVASQVRADRSSSNLSSLKQASTGVKTATAHVIATAKDCAQLIEESDDMDVTKLSPHMTKRLELETQAEVLRLESDLEKSRMKLAALRQHHYHNSDG